MILAAPIVGSAASPNVEDNLSVFKTHAGEIGYLEAYNATLAQWPVTYEYLFIPTRFGPTHVIASGPNNAPPLALLHAATASATQWFPNVKNLSRNFRVYAIDTLGDAGMSKVIKAPQNKSDYALWLSDVFDGLGFQKADLIGSSYGGWLALDMALYEPDRVEKIVLLSPANALAPFNRMYFLRVAITSFIRNKWLIEHVSIRPLFAKEPNGPFLEQLWQAAENAQFRLVFPTEFTDDELRQIEIPALLLIGDRDIVIDPQMALNWSKLMPNCQAELVPDAGHIMNQDQPAKVDALILKYLKT